MFIKKLIIILIICFSILSCISGPSSTDNFSTAPLNGKIFDHDNLPCSGVLVTVDKHTKVKSDINGRFVVPALSKGEHTFVLTKDSYEVLEFNYDFINKNQVLWLKMFSLDQIIQLIEKKFDEHEYHEANKLIQRGKAINPNHAVLLYLNAIFFMKNELYEDAVNDLKKIIENGDDEPIIYLTLADIYQENLNDPAQALIYLEKYASFNLDDVTRRRIEYLRKITSQK